MKQKATELEILTPEEKATVYNLSTAYFKTYSDVERLLIGRYDYFDGSTMRYKWQELGPLSIEQVIWNTPVDMIFDPYEVSLEFKNQYFGSTTDVRIIGMFKSGTGIAHGIASENIGKNPDRYYEGYFVDGRWNGFGRLIFANGDYYLG